MTKPMGKEKRNRFSRRVFLGAGFLLPFLSVAKPPLTESVSEKKEAVSEEDEYTTMLTAKGGVVRVKKSALKNAKVVKQKMSNKSLLHWLKLKDKG